MKSRIIKIIPSLGLLALIFLLPSCGDTTESTGSSVAVATPDVVSAPQEYADIINNALKAGAKFDFDSMHKDFAVDAVQYWPDGDSETRSSLNGKAEIVAWWKNWLATSGVEKMDITKVNIIPLQVNKPLKYYNIEGTVVLAYFDSEQVYNGQSVKVRLHWAYLFNDDKKITRVFSYYDRTNIIEAVKANLIKSGVTAK